MNIQVNPKIGILSILIFYSNYEVCLFTNALNYVTKTFCCIFQKYIYVLIMYHVIVSYILYILFSLSSTFLFNNFLILDLDSAIFNFYRTQRQLSYYDYILWLCYMIIPSYDVVTSIHKCVNVLSTYKCHFTSFSNYFVCIMVSILDQCT